MSSLKSRQLHVESSSRDKGQGLLFSNAGFLQIGQDSFSYW